MSGFFSKLWPHRITTQIVLLVVTSLFIAHVVITAALFALFPRPNHLLGPGATTARLSLLAVLLDAASGDQRATIMHVAQAQIPELELGDLPPGARSMTHGPVADDIRSQFGARVGIFELPPGATVRPPRIAIRLVDGSALIAPMPSPPRWGEPSPALIVAIATLASAIALLSVWAARALTAPLARFADAAERFTLGRAEAPLPESGPREITRMARALNGMRERVRRMVEDRARMLAAISHDLRTPITRLRLRAEDIEPLSLRDPVIRDLDTMQSMIHSALSFLRDHQTRAEHVPLDLPSLVQAICDDFGDIGREVRFDGPLHIHVNGNPEQLARAVTNLIENGLKFGTRVAVTLRAADNTAVIDVQDDGPGIPDAVKTRVFEPFYRADDARNADDMEGFGLGLSISRAIAEAHHGSLSIHDAIPKGVVARLTLPLDQVQT